ncbi:MAG: hypothetical protein Tsb0020_16920 [Haliangiales bacterium]
MAQKRSAWLRPVRSASKRTLPKGVKHAQTWVIVHRVGDREADGSVTIRSYHDQARVLSRRDQKV